jgi:hypothetical protein
MISGIRLTSQGHYSRPASVRSETHDDLIGATENVQGTKTIARQRRLSLEAGPQEGERLGSLKTTVDETDLDDVNDHHRAKMMNDERLTLVEHRPSNEPVHPGKPGGSLRGSLTGLGRRGW